MQKLAIAVLISMAMLNGCGDERPTAPEPAAKLTVSSSVAGTCEQPPCSPGFGGSSGTSTVAATTMPEVPDTPDGPPATEPPTEPPQVATDLDLALMGTNMYRWMNQYDPPRIEMYSFHQQNGVEHFIQEVPGSTVVYETGVFSSTADSMSIIMGDDLSSHGCTVVGSVYETSAVYWRGYAWQRVLMEYQGDVLNGEFGPFVAPPGYEDYELPAIEAPISGDFVCGKPDDAPFFEDSSAGVFRANIQLFVNDYERLEETGNPLAERIAAATTLDSVRQLQGEVDLFFSSFLNLDEVHDSATIINDAAIAYLRTWDGYGSVLRYRESRILNPENDFYATSEAQSMQFAEEEDAQYRLLKATMTSENCK